ncbi:stage V sporulation protein T [Anoxybacter fermentans]|uniref:Stage V sporulation protein T n=1 Tax=Anoxybacter fermentans TaxID=1323375 RepID=A0A3S9T1Y9_9FIRM|nr:stage V sporulation protein T [Anoxybacter fermentans]AZR74571.1 stage V sporulation protein T [Anoxybacter fermentans]
MKATGIVRRIDELGRVVIPKEIRRTMKIREGEPLEIFVDRNGEVILKKYSPIGELSEFAQEYADSLAEVTNYVACVLDKDAVVAVAGAPRKEYLEKPLSAAARKVMETGETTIINEPGAHAFCEGCKAETEDCKFSSTVLAPITLSDGQVVGLVVLSSKDPDTKMGELEVKLANTAAGFLAKQMES